MNKKLSAKDRLIFSVLFLLDRSAEAHDYFQNPRAIEPHRLHSDMAGRYLQEISKDPVNRTALCRLKDNDGISLDKNDFSLLVEPQSFKKTYYWKKFKLVLEDKEWDGWWRVVVFDIPEKNRNLRRTIRYHLKKIGFVYWQKSVWVTIFDAKKELDEVIKNMGIEDYIVVLQSKNIGSIGDKEVIEKFFPAKKTSDGYKRFIARTKMALRMRDKSLIRKACGEFVELVYADPGIPSDFLEDKNLRKKAVKLFRKASLAGWETKNTV